MLIKTHCTIDVLYTSDGREVQDPRSSTNSRLVQAPDRQCFPEHLVQYDPPDKVLELVPGLVRKDL